MNLKLFIFNPGYYREGAMGVIAESFEHAVNIIIEADRVKAREVVRNLRKSGITSKVAVSEYRNYYKWHFLKTEKKLEKDDDVNYWFLAHEVELAGDHKPHVLFDSWTYLG